MQIHEITLLTSDEYQSLRHLIPDIHKSWWLKDISSNDCPNIVAGINGDVFSWAFPGYKRYVRPALRISGVQVRAGEKLTIFAYPWTVLETIDNVTLVLCDIPVTLRIYDKVYSKWENSELKNWLETWLDRRLKCKSTKKHQRWKTMNQVGIAYTSNKFLTHWVTPMSLTLPISAVIAYLTYPLNNIAALPTWTRVISITMTVLVALCATACALLTGTRAGKSTLAGHIINTAMLLCALLCLWCNTTISGCAIMLACAVAGVINISYLQTRKIIK